MQLEKVSGTLPLFKLSRVTSKKLMTKTQGIYKITNIVNGKFYIGSSVNLKNRLANHFSKLRNNKHSNIYLQRAFTVHGEANFKCEILEVTDNLHQSELLDIEQKYLDNIEDWSLSYNLTKSTKAFGTIYADEVEKKAKKSARVSGENNPFYGKTHSKATIKALCEVHLKSGKGITKTKNGRFEVKIKKRIYIGTFDSYEEAVKYRLIAEKYYYEGDDSAKDILDSIKRDQKKLPKGVVNRAGKYVAKITINKKVHWLGTFDTPELAYAARLSAEQSLLS